MSRVSKVQASPTSRVSRTQAIIIGVIAVVSVAFAAWYFLSGPSHAVGTPEQQQLQQKQSLRGMGG